MFERFMTSAVSRGNTTLRSIGRQLPGKDYSSLRTVKSLVLAGCNGMVQEEDGGLLKISPEAFHQKIHIDDVAFTTLAGSELNAWHRYSDRSTRRENEDEGHRILPSASYRY
jgi:hypothetical protein